MTENNHKHSDKTRRGTSPRGMYSQDFLVEQLKDEEVRAENEALEAEYSEKQAQYDRWAEETVEFTLVFPSDVRQFLEQESKVAGLTPEEVAVERLMEAMQNLSEATQQSGTAEMSLGEINAEIEAVRVERKTRGGRRGVDDCRDGGGK